MILSYHKVLCYVTQNSGGYFLLADIMILGSQKVLCSVTKNPGG